MALRRGTGSWALTYGASTKMAVEKGSLDLPRKPGVYLFRNNDGRVMYVGKATEIRVGWHLTSLGVTVGRWYRG